MAQERVVLQQEGIDIAQRYDALFFEASAKNPTNLDKIFTRLVKEIAYAYKVSGTVPVPIKKPRQRFCIVQ